MTPYRSAEVRWFGRGEIPDAIESWFAGLTSASPDGPDPETETRTDRYLAPTSDALGVKLREGQVEAKRRDAVLAPLAAVVDGLAESVGEAEVELWTKWSFPLAEAVDEIGDAWVAVAKARRQRHADECALELSRLEVEGEAWWSVCLEASGPDPNAALAGAARRWLATAPPLPESQALGYPAWLRSR